MSGYTRKIEEVIEKIPYNQLIVANTLYNTHFSDIPGQTYYKVLERMVKRGDLVHLTKGLYYRPKITRFGIIPISEEEITRHYTEKEQGIVIGYQLYNRKGITTQVGKHTEVLSTVLSEEKKHIQNVAVSKVSLTLNEETIPVIETLEILQNYSKIEDVNNKVLIAYMEQFAKHYSENAVDYVIQNRKYKKSTIAFLAAFLNHMSVENNLDKYLSPLSEYGIPKVETLYELA